MNPLLTQLEDLVARLPASAQAALAGASTRRAYPKGAYLLRPGEVCRCSYLIETGLARRYDLVDGRELTTEFYFPDDLALALTSYATQTPGTEAIQVLEPTTTWRTDYRVFEELKREHPPLLELDLRLTEYYAVWLEERLRQFRTLDATQRYQLLLRTQPHWTQRLPLTHLASYLGVSLETLSRIRAKRI